MGGEDNSLFRSKLLNYLQIIYNQPTPDNNWINTNYTVAYGLNADRPDDKTVRCRANNQFSIGA